MGAAWEAGTAANVSAATANARIVFRIEFLGRKADFEVAAARRQQHAAIRTGITNRMMSQLAVLKFDRDLPSCDQINCWKTVSEQIVKL